MISDSAEKPPIRMSHNFRAMGLLRMRDTPEWLERVIAEFRDQECSVGLELTDQPWDLVVIPAGKPELRLVWCDEVLNGSAFVVQIIHPGRSGSPGERSIFRHLAARLGAVPLVATYQGARPMRDRWKIVKV